MSIDAQASAPSSTRSTSTQAGQSEDSSAFQTQLDAILRRLDVATLPQRAISFFRDVVESLKISFRWNTLTSRIMALNLAVLAVILTSIFWFSKTEEWLIEEKTTSLKTQGEIIAAAMAFGLRDPNRRQVQIDPDSFLSRGAGLPPGADALSALERTIKPERIAYVLQEVIQPTGVRARVYDGDGDFVMDSDLLSSGLSFDSIPSVIQVDEAPDTVAGFWERARAWFDRVDLPVYKDIGTANGKTYSEVRAALQGVTTPLLLVTNNGNKIISVALPIRHLNKVQGALLLSTREGDIETLVTTERRNLFTVAFFALVAILLSSVLIAHKFGRPLHDLSEGAERVHQSLRRREEIPDLTHRTDEIGHLSATLRDMTDALYRRIESSERFAADVTHELKNPLTSVRSAAESLRLHANDQEQRDDLSRTIEHDVRRLTRLIDDISKSTRLDADMTLTDLEPVDMAALLETLASMFNDSHVRNEQQVTIAFSGGDPESDVFQIEGHDSPLGQVMRNLIDNALSFSPEDGTVHVSAQRTDNAVIVTVEDDGPGIPEDNLERIFSRFYTDRPGAEAFGKNSGLGLSISQDIVRAHGGEIAASNRLIRDPLTGRREKAGACFTVRLPAPQLRQKTGTRRSRHNTPPPGHKTNTQPSAHI